LWFVKAVIFDFIGTLANVKNYNLEDSKMKMCRAIANAGFNLSDKDFLDAYSKAHEKYRAVRYGKLIEVTNAIWIAEALTNLGFETAPEDTRIKTAVNVFFEDYLRSLELRPCAKKMLERFSMNYKLGLVSNFTYAPVIYAGLRKLDINRFFNAVVVSEEVGWRKPHAKIFEETLRRLAVKAEEAVYVGDSPIEDVQGAKDAGMKTIFVASQFHSIEELFESKQQLSLVVKDICELYDKSPRIFCTG
jgi:putative hydrolase of the HAD superfamily